MFIVTINNKSERNYRGKCLGWPVTSYGAGNVYKVHIFRDCSVEYYAEIQKCE